MGHHFENESKRVPQHLLAREVVSLAHGAADASKAEAAHKEAFSHGTNMFSLSALRRTLAEVINKDTERSSKEQQLFDYKQAYAAASTVQNVAGATTEPSKADASNIVTLPLTLLRTGSFPAVLHAAGLANSRSEGRRLIMKKGAYVVLPNSGTAENTYGLKWETIPDAINTTDPNHYLVDFHALVLRSGKSKIQICRIVTEEQFEAEGLTCPGWEELKAHRADAAS